MAVIKTGFESIVVDVGSIGSMPAPTATASTLGMIDSKTVTAAGTAEQITATSTNCIKIDIMALAANTGKVFIGSSAVNSLNIFLEAGGSYSVTVPSGNYVDLSEYYVDSAVSGEGITVNYLSI